MFLFPTTTVRNIKEKKKPNVVSTKALQGIYDDKTLAGFWCGRLICGHLAVLR